MTKFLKEVAAVEEMWATLRVQWSECSGDGFRQGQKVWRRTCEVFDVYIEEIDNDRWSLTITNEDKLIHKQPLAAAKFTDACKEGDCIIYEFLALACQELSGMRPTMEHPWSEVRFAQILYTDRDLLGLTKEGVIYRWSHGSWSPTRMDRDTSDIRPLAPLSP